MRTLRRMWRVPWKENKQKLLYNSGIENMILRKRKYLEQKIREEGGYSQQGKIDEKSSQGRLEMMTPLLRTKKTLKTYRETEECIFKYSIE